MDEVIGRPQPASEGGADEREIRALADAWSRALERRDVDGLTAAYADDVVLFDVKPPARAKGIAAIRRLWEACLPSLPARFTSERRDFEVSVAGDIAFAHCLHRIRPLGEQHPAAQSWVRVTVCYRRLDGGWRVVHEHASFPFDPETGRISLVTGVDDAEHRPDDTDSNLKASCEDVMKIEPYLMFDGRCAEAFTFYEAVLAGKIEMMMTFGEAPEECPSPADWRDKIMHASLIVGDQRLMGSDSPPQFQETPQGFSVSINVEDAGEAERIFGALSEGGTIRMPIGETFWAIRFGMLVDRFGTPWMVNCSRPM